MKVEVTKEMVLGYLEQTVRKRVGDLQGGDLTVKTRKAAMVVRDMGKAQFTVRMYGPASVTVEVKEATDA